MSRPHILFVDDEEDLLALAGPFLSRTGYQPHLATSASQALRIWGRYQNHIGLVITDWVLPDLFGDQFVTRLLEQQPSLKVIFTSANPIACLDAPFQLQPNVNYFQKPFSFLHLLRVVRQALKEENFTDQQNAALS